MDWKVERKGLHDVDVVVHAYKLVKDFFAACVDEGDTSDSKAPGSVNHLAIHSGDVEGF